MARCGWRRRAAGCALLLVAAFAPGCAASEASSAAPDRRGAAAETSVRPGINAKFLSEDLDVDRYVAIFEVESREVFALRAQLVERLELERGDAVADVGAGTGLFVSLFAERVGPGGRVYAVEIAPRFLDHLRERARSEGLASVTVVHAREDSVELPRASVDLAWLCDTYHHFEYPKSTLASLFRAVRPGGSLVLVDFRRVPGESEDWILEHVRAGQEVFAAEIEAAGFVLAEEIDAGLEQNYMLRFERPAVPVPAAP